MIEEDAENNNNKHDSQIPLALEESHILAVPYFITYFRFIEDRIIKIVFLFVILYYNKYQRLFCGFCNHMYMRSNCANSSLYPISSIIIFYLLLLSIWFSFYVFQKTIKTICYMDVVKMVMHRFFPVHLI